MLDSIRREGLTELALLTVVLFDSLSTAAMTFTPSVQTKALS